jgi:colanic acid/amylovoran biosynthesis glycosyltransferase
VPIRGDAERGDALQGEAVRGDALRGDALRGDAVRGDAVPSDTVPGDEEPGDAARSVADRGGAAVKVCLVADTFPRLSETFVIQQAAGLAARGHEVGVLASALDRPGAARVPGLGACRARWGPLAPLAAKGAHLSDRMRHRMRVALDPLDRAFLRRYDIILAHFGYEGLRVAELAARHGPLPPLVTIFHGHDVATVRHDGAMALYRPLFARGALHLAVNRPFRDALIEGGAPAERTRVCHMGVATDEIPFLERVAAGPVSILSVCRLTEKKGIADALRGLRELRGRRPELDWRYRIIGDGEQAGELRALAHALAIDDRVEFLGARPHEEVKRRLSEADVFLLPSVTAANGDAEGVPVSLMEAMASGALVVSTRHSGIPDLVEDGVSGFLAPERDPRALSVALEAAAVPQDRAAVARAARRRVEAEFDLATQLDTLEELLAGVLRRVAPDTFRPAAPPHGIPMARAAPVRRTDGSEAP